MGTISLKDWLVILRSSRVDPSSEVSLRLQHRALSVIRVPAATAVSTLCLPQREPSHVFAFLCQSSALTQHLLFSPCNDYQIMECERIEKGGEMIQMQSCPWTLENPQG